jgi:hypothetical protein
LLVGGEASKFLLERCLHNRFDLDVDALHLLPAGIPSTGLHKAIAGIDLHPEYFPRTEGIVLDFVPARRAPVRLGPKPAPDRAGFVIVIFLSIVGDAHLVRRA